MAKTNKSANAKPIVDVAHPGKSAPAGNSKSVIVSNRPLLKDPMVSAVDQPKSDSLPLTAPLLETEAPDEPAETTEPAKTTKTIEPTEPTKPVGSEDTPNSQSDEQEPDKLDESKPGAAEPKKPDKPETGAADESETDKPKSDETKPDESETKKSETANEEAPPQEDDAKQLEAETTQQAEHQAAIDKLADSKKYYLPINTVEKRRSKRFVVLGIVLSLLLAMAWVDVALDAGLIQLGGIKPLTHFFSN